jgi:probable HAF family extracellular repeat protein
VKKLGILLCVLVMLGLATYCYAVEYEIIDLGTLGGPHSFALAINEAGQVAGNSWTASGELHPCLWVPLTPENQLWVLRQYITHQVASGHIQAELQQGLLAKVDAAIAALARANPNDAKVAMNDLKALVNQVEAQTGKKIDPAVAAEVIARANRIIAALGGQ